jgi:hypothetical protein
MSDLFNQTPDDESLREQLRKKGYVQILGRSLKPSPYWKRPDGTGVIREEEAFIEAGLKKE